MTRHPAVLFVVSFLVLWVSAQIGWWFQRRLKGLDEDSRHDFGFIMAATLTLLGLLIGFSFSMATGRYDLRKNYEEEEANAIGTEYLRADLLHAYDAVKVRELLTHYLDQRVRFYMVKDKLELRQIDARTAQLQADLWTTILAPATAQPTPVVALAVSGMNDVLNSQGYTQAGYWNRIPVSAWALMGMIAIACNFLVGFGSRSVKAIHKLLPVLPLVVATSFMLIAEIDTPRHGIIRVSPQNLISLAESLCPHGTDNVQHPNPH